MKNKKVYKEKEFYLKNRNLTNKQLAVLAGCSESTINYHKKKLNLAKNLLKEPTWSYTKLLEITPESMYWAGFILADGCFSQETRKEKLSISSSVLDEDHIIKFKNWINSNNSLYYSKDNCVSISLYSKEYIPQIMRFWNFHYRKTYIPYEVPSKVQNSKYFKYFIVGLIDGDGSVVKTASGYRISITQHKSQRVFLQEIQDWVGNNNPVHEYNRDNTANIFIQRKDLREKVKKWYLELENLPLQRKLEKMI